MTAAATSQPASAGFVDLHAHSTASDGAALPADGVAAAARAGLAALALTDHDTMAGVDEAEEAGRRLGVRIVAGTELSAHDGGRELHLLGLHLEDRTELESALQRFRDRRRDRAASIVAKLQALGVPVTLDAVFAQAAGGAVGRPHVARALVAVGAVRDHREAFDRYLGTGRAAFVDKEFLAIGDAVRLVHEAGGVVVFAHPGQDGTRERVERMVALGLDGLEVIHPSQGAEDVARLGALVEHFGLVRSGGSDWHGAPEGGGMRALGGMRVPAQWLDEQDERVAMRRGAARD